MIWLLLALAGCTGGATEESEETATTEDTGDTGVVSGSGVVQVSVGQDFPCARIAEGDAVCWGQAQEGPVPVLEGSYRWVATGVWDVLAITEAGALECHTTAGTSHLCSVAPGGEGWVAASLHCGEACALREDGDAVCWGAGGPERLVPGPWTSLVVGHDIACFLAPDGAVSCDPTGHEPAALTMVDADRSHACGITPAGELVCWVPDGLGVPEGMLDLPDGTFTTVDLAGQAACALDSAGALLCWGIEDRALPEPPEGRFAQVGVGGGFGCVVDTEGGIQCWGESTMGGGDLTPPW